MCIRFVWCKFANSLLKDYGVNNSEVSPIIKIKLINVTLKKLMLDYKLLIAFSNVVERGSFEKAALHMGLTQSAVSQRVKLLESRLGKPVLIRGAELKTTEVGQALLNHVAKVQLLEEQLASSVALPDSEAIRIRVAVNADSVSCWWFPAVSDYFNNNNVMLDIVIEDQNYGLDRMKKGDVSACLCTAPTPLQGARCAYIGDLECSLYASPSFKQLYFPQGITKQAVEHAPAVIYGYKDELHDVALKDLKLPTTYPFHICPSSEGIEQMINTGMAYGVLATKQAEPSVENGKCSRLVSIEQTPGLSIPLYWHYWRQGAELFERLIPSMEQALKRV